MNRIKICDITFVAEFFDDFEGVPQLVQDRFEQKINQMLDQIDQRGWTLIHKSFNAHKIEDSDVWIGHLTIGKDAWRVLFDIDTNDVIHFWHIKSHKEMDLYIKRYKYT